MAEKYFDTQALLGVTIRDPKIFGADITGKRLSLSENYDYPASGKPFLPGYTYSVDPQYGFTIGFMSGPSAGETLLQVQYKDGANKFVQDSMSFNGMASFGFFRGTMPAGTINAVRSVEFLTDPVQGFSEVRGVEIGGELIVTDRTIYDPWTPYSWAPDQFGAGVNRRGSIGVASRTSYSSSSFPGQITMRSWNTGDNDFPSNMPMIEFDRAGAAVTPKIGFTNNGNADELKILSGKRASGDAKSGMTFGITGIDVVGPLRVGTPSSANEVASKSYVDSAVGSGNSSALAGAIILWGTGTPPPGWLSCDGSAISRTSYAALFAIIGTNYGAGNGTTTFNLPDLRSRTAVGGDGRDPAFYWTVTGGSKTHTLTTAEMPSHAHDQYVTAGGGGPASRVDYSGDSTGQIYPQGIQTGPMGGGAAHNNLQPYLVLNYIIKA